MLVARNIRVWTLDRDSITVTWDLENSAEDFSGYSVSVWRAESMAGPYVRISMEMNANDFFEIQDRGVNQFSKWREFYYRIRLTKTADSTYQDYGSTPIKNVLRGDDPGGVSMEAVPDLEAMEAIRRMDLTLREFAGRRVLALVERTWGQRCPDCWDNVKRRRNRSNCITCFDTGLTGGFFHPQQTRCMKPPARELVALTSLFEMQPNDVVMWFNSTPRLKPRDIIIDTDGRRWRAIVVNESEKGWALTRQTIQMREISKDQVEYKIPIDPDDWGKDNFTSSPLRQFIRATDIDSYNKAVQDLGIAEEEVFQERSDMATQVENT